MPAEKRNLGLVFQSYALWPHRTVFDNVAYGLKLRKVASAEVRQRVDAALANSASATSATRLPHQLSGGQQQRVAIARALVYNPPVILMDEPLSNLDAKLREEARAWLRELILKMRLSALVVTHDQNEAMAMSDRILLLNNGVIEQEGTPQELYGQPRTLFVADFMGSNNRVEGKVVERRGSAALLAGDGWQLWGEARGAGALGADAGDRHDPPRARPAARTAPARTSSSCRWSPRCSSATAGSTCSTAATCACAPTDRMPLAARRPVARDSRRRASGSSDDGAADAAAVGRSPGRS